MQLAMILERFPEGISFVIDMVHPPDPGVWRNHPDGQYTFLRVRTAEDAARVARDNTAWRCSVRRQMLDRESALWEDAPS